MRPPLSLATAALLTVPPLLWAANAVLGRVLADAVPPMTLNFLRWALAFVLLLPLAAPWLRRGSGLWPHWRRYAALGLFGVGLYNALQYLALHTSTPLNVTLVGASVPLWMMAIGVLFFGARLARRDVLAALASMAGVLLVLSHGHWQLLLELKLVPGDVYMVLATISWALYSWLLARTDAPAGIRHDWAGLLIAQMVFGVLWSGALAGGEWLVLPAPRIDWGWPLAAALLFIALGPAILAYRCWGMGVQRAGPSVASLFANLTPLFAALMSAAFMGELPHWYHGAAFVLIVLGIVISARR